MSACLATDGWPPGAAPAADAQSAVLDLAAEGRLGAALTRCRADLASSTGRRWLTDAIIDAMTREDLRLAGALASIHAALDRASRWAPSWAGGASAPLAEAWVTLPKLRHDVAQFRRLRAAGSLGPDFDVEIARCEAALRDLAALGDDGRIPLAEAPTLEPTFGRLVHQADAPRVATALSRGWSRVAAEHHYLQGSPALVVIDDFLSEEALQGLLNFCIASTVWTQNRYGHGRLGALFFNGFNAPLLLQIAEEVRAAFPRLIGAVHPLRQLWGFKNTGELPADTTIHADFAAVNVNFWITPDDANLDPASGGMVVYDLEAPLSWDFNRYNERSDLIQALIRERAPRVIRIPYLQNRAIIFNSDLFHATERVCFRPGLENHRINVTLLYGDRHFDALHDEPAAAPAMRAVPAWRSAAFRSRP